jgi:transposase
MHTTEASELYGGADLHGNNVFLALKDAQGKTVFKRRVKANLEAVNGAMSPFWPRLQSLAVEATFNWYWFVDGLREEKRPVILANPAKMEQYEGLKETDDSTDAEWLAEQVRLGIVPECYVYPKAVRPIRDLLRRRALIVRQRTQSLLSLESLLSRYGLSAPGVDKLKQWTSDDVQELGLDEFSQLQAQTLRVLMQKQSELIETVEKAVLKKVKPSAEFERIQQVPGIGKILGMVILLESGEFNRFASAGNYASYCRAVKSLRSSNGKKKGENNRKNGNPYLAWAYIEAATFAARYSARTQAWYERKKNRRNVAVAKKALACKLAKAVWHVMKGNNFDERMLFG